jgi:hypothetical protein
VKHIPYQRIYAPKQKQVLRPIKRGATLYGLLIPTFKVMYSSRTTQTFLGFPSLIVHEVSIVDRIPCQMVLLPPLLRITTHTGWMKNDIIVNFCTGKALFLA